jgi:large subunit ribosomal protein L9
MKVILNKDLNPLGEEGDVRDVAKGYARNYLFPRGIALPYTESTIKLFESRREEIDARKEDKRKDALGLKEKLEGLELLLSMPAGPNGKLYGAVTSQTVTDELLKQGFPVERKRVELPGNSFKSVGKYKVTVKLYESASAEVTVTVQGQEIKVEAKSPPPNRPRRHRDTEERTEHSTPETSSQVPPEHQNETEPEPSPAASPDTGTAELSQE